MIIYNFKFIILKYFDMGLMDTNRKINMNYNFII